MRQDGDHGDSVVFANMLVLAAEDNVGVALKAIETGEMALDSGGRKLRSNEAIPPGHKIALARIGEGEKIVRFGVPVGIAKSTIRPGQHVHVHNVRSQFLDNDEDHYE